MNYIGILIWYNLELRNQINGSGWVDIKRNKGQINYSYVTVEDILMSQNS